MDACSKLVYILWIWIGFLTSTLEHFNEIAPQTLHSMKLIKKWFCFLLTVCAAMLLWPQVCLSWHKRWFISNLDSDLNDHFIAFFHVKGCFLFLSFKHAGSAQLTHPLTKLPLEMALPFIHFSFLFFLICLFFFICFLTILCVCVLFMFCFDLWVCALFNFISDNTFLSAGNYKGGNRI